MLRICLQRAFRPALRKLPKAAGTARHAPSCWMGTHGRNEPLEPLNSPTRAKEFIYRLHPKERTCLLQELQIFESKALAQDEVEPSPPTAAQIRYGERLKQTHTYVRAHTRVYLYAAYPNH
uniref:Transmembrane protein 65 n=1 Tax=Haplochromis burtoni TaxID=8153 RepID=A0A3Q2WEB6_HAPBU